MPIPSSVVQEFKISMEELLPENWTITKWDPHSFSLWQLWHGQIPEIRFKLNSPYGTLPFQLQGTWNQSLKQPEFNIHGKTQWIMDSNKTNTIDFVATLQFRDGFSNLHSWQVECKEKQTLDLDRFGKLEGFSATLKPLEPEKFSIQWRSGPSQIHIPIAGHPNLNISWQNAQNTIAYNYVENSVEKSIEKLNLSLSKPLLNFRSWRGVATNLNFEKKASSIKKQGTVQSDSPISLMAKDFKILKNFPSMASSRPLPTPKEIHWNAKVEEFFFQGHLYKDHENWGFLKSSLSLNNLSYKMPSKSAEGIIETAKFSISGLENKFKIFGDFTSGSLIWGESFYNLPNQGISFQIQRHSDNYAGTIQRLLQFPVSLGLACSDTACLLNWQMKSDLARDLETLTAMAPDWEPPSQKISALWNLEGQLQFQKNGTPNWRTFQNHFELTNGSLIDSNGQWAFRGFHLKLPIKADHSTQAKATLTNGQYRNLKTGFNIDPWLWHFNSHSKEISFGIPRIDLQGDLSFIKIRNHNLKWTSSQRFAYSGTIKGRSEELPSLLEKLCFSKSTRVPPSVLNFSFSPLSIDQNQILLGGPISLKAFKGQAIGKQFKVFRWLESVPETQFEFDASGFQLGAIGEWLKFGKMKGRLQAYAHQVVLQSTLPTQFLGKISLDPLDESSEVVFSAKAMKNFTQLFTPEDFLGQIPGVMQWLAFGWPSDLIGGYNIQYAGLTLFAKDGSILVESLDPPSVVAKENQHFLLYGNRFKIPIQSFSYPIVLDGPGLSQFISHVYYQLIALKKEQESQEGKNENTENWCQFSLDP